MTHSSETNVVLRIGAEFVVIVVGVLVAFGVDDWASEREDRRDELQYLEQLEDELGRDSATLANGLIPSAERGLTALGRVESVRSGATSFPSDTTALLLDVLAGGRRGQFVRLGTRSTVDELLSTGSLRLIESASLRSAIINYYGDKDLAERRLEAAKSRYGDIVSRYLPVAASGGLVDPPGDGFQEEMLRDHGLARSARVIATLDFEAAITGQQNFFRLMAPILNSLLAENMESSAAVEAERRRLRQGVSVGSV